MKKHTDKYLAVEPIKGINTNDTDECIIHCIKTKNCTSINYWSLTDAEDEQGYCDILETDWHRNFSKYVNTSEISKKVTHFSIQVSLC